jgi:hypothetical protein
MHLSTPALFAPFVRVQLLGWDPLYSPPEGGGYKGFDEQAWCVGADISRMQGFISACRACMHVHLRTRARAWEMSGGVRPCLRDTACLGCPATGALQWLGSIRFVPARRYGELFEYGMAGGGAGEDDPDGELVPQLVRKLVLPLALTWLER